MSVVIVTGGTDGIGKATSLELARRGHRVVAFGLEGSALVAEDAAREGLAVDALEADVSRAADVERVVAFALQRHGRIDALVNNAAIGPLGTILDTSEELWDRVIDVNLKGYFLCCKAVLPHLLAQGGGAIVNVGSGAGWGKPNMFAYAASKGGVFALSSALAYDFFRHGIRVNTVVPGGGGLNTGMSRGRAASGMKVFSPDGYTGTVAGRTARAEDIAHAVCFLLSPEAAVISGAILDVGCFAHQGGPIPPKAQAPAAQRTE